MTDISSSTLRTRIKKESAATSKIAAEYHSALHKRSRPQKIPFGSALFVWFDVFRAERRTGGEQRDGRGGGGETAGDSGGGQGAAVGRRPAAGRKQRRGLDGDGWKEVSDGT